MELIFLLELIEVCILDDIKYALQTPAIKITTATVDVNENILV